MTGMKGSAIIPIPEHSRTYVIASDATHEHIMGNRHYLLNIIASGAWQSKQKEK